MRDVILHLNYVHVLVVTMAGYLLGCLWCHGPLFGKIWMREMKFTQESMEAEMKKKGMAGYFLKGFGFTLLSTFGLAVLLALHGTPNWKHGAAFAAFVGLFGPGVRLLNGMIWDYKSVTLQAVYLTNEVAIYALQGALLAMWQ